MNRIRIWTCSMISVCLICLQSSAIMAAVQLEISKISKFPVSVNKSFQIKMSSQNQSRLFDHATDFMFIRITDAFRLTIDKHIYDYAIKETIDLELISEYLRIPVWERNDSDHSITMEIWFTSKANSKTLEVYQISANTTKQRKEKLNNLTLAHLIYRADIRLLIPPKLDLSIQSEDGRKDEVQIDQTGIAKCRSHGGVPPIMPEWKNASIFTVLKTSKSTETNEITLNFHVSLLDHLKILYCKAGETEESVKVLVLHHPSKITLQPDVNGFVENGSTINCNATDGYPTPVMSWSLLDGPQDSARYFNVSQGGKSLHLNGMTPLGSKWTFNCTARSIISGSVKILNRTVSFVVGHKMGKTSEFRITYQVMIAIPILGSVVLFCIVIGFSIFSSIKVTKSRVKTLPSSKNWAYDETTFDETIFDTNLIKNYYSPQCTLLKPQTSLKDIEIAKNRSHSLPFTPKLQFMLDNNGNPFIFLDQEVTFTTNDDNLMYPIQTFMPIYDPQNPNEETAEYAQIIGTLRPSRTQDPQ